jgi:outer membrane protein TolC
MFRRLLLLLFTAGICFFVSAMALAEDGSHAEEELTIEQAIAVALKNNPSIRVANEARIAGRARIGQTQSAYYPYVNLQTRYSRSWQEASQSSARNHYGNTFELSQLIFDFGRTPGLVGSARESYESLKESYQNSRQTVALNTKVAYYAYLAYERELMLTEEIVRQRNQLLHQAKQFFKTGLKPRIDVTRAEANLYDAKLSFIKAQNGLQIAKINLVNALGIEKLPWR